MSDFPEELGSHCDHPRDKVVRVLLCKECRALGTICRKCGKTLKQEHCSCYDYPEEER